MKFFVDFFPILLFFLAYKFYDIYVATAVAIVAAIGQVIYTWFTTRKFEQMQLITLAIIVVFGGATLVLEDETFIKWKPTVVNWLFAVVFLASQYIGEKNLVQRMMGASISLPSRMWAWLNLSWAVFFIFLGIANLYVMSHFDTDTWVNFKLFGMMGLTLAFVFLQGIFIFRHAKEVDGNKGQ